MSHQIPENLQYTDQHEWILVEGDSATIGITDFAQSSLGDIVFLELPEPTAQVGKGNSFGVVESIKSVSDLYAPLSGEILEINSALCDKPEKMNSDPYKNWLVKIKITNQTEISALLSAPQYQEICSSN